MRSYRVAIVVIHSLFIAAGLAMLSAPLVIHGGDPRTYTVGLLYGALLFAGTTLALLWAGGLWLQSSRVSNFALVTLGILSASGMAFTYSLLPGLAGLAYFCCSLGMMEAGDMLDDAWRVTRATAPASRTGLARPSLPSIARKASWTLALAAATGILSVLSLLIVFNAGGVLASTALSFLALSLIGWLAYNLASGENADEND